MTLLTDAMWEFLSTNTSLDGDHVFPWRMTKDQDLPCCTFQFIPSAGPVRVHDDAHTETPTTSHFDRRRMQWDLWAHSYREIEELGQEFKHLLHGFRGMMGDLNIGSIHIDIELDSYEEDIRVYRRILDGMVRYNDILVPAS